MYQKKLLWIEKLYIKELLVMRLNSKRNLILNKVNWNISVTLGIKIKRDYLLF